MDRRETHIYVVIKRIYIPSGGGGFCLGEGSTAVFRLFLQFGSELFMMDCLFNLLYCRVQWGEYNYQIGLLDLKTSCFLLLLLLPIKKSHLPSDCVKNKRRSLKETIPQHLL